jgi:hypothetical protein
LCPAAGLDARLGLLAVNFHSLMMLSIGRVLHQRSAI